MQRARSLVWACWVGVLAVYAFAYLMPTDLFASGRIELALAFFVFMLRTFLLHGAIVLAVLAVCAAAVRARRLAALVSVTAVLMASPSLMPMFRSAPTSDPARPTLTVVVANVNFANQNLGPLFELVRAEQADVVLLQEATRAHAPQLRAGFQTSHPHSAEAFRQDAFGQAVYSKLPFAAGEEIYPQIEMMREKIFGGVAGISEPQIRVRIAFDGVPLILQNLHLVPPGDAQLLCEQRLQFAWLDQWVRSVHAASDAPALLLAGDLNSTTTSPQHAFLRSAGLHESHSEAGSGLGNTWPDAGLLAKLPGIRIDHVYVNDRLRVVSSRVGPSIGSDHRPLVVRLQTRTPQRSGAPTP